MLLWKDTYDKDSITYKPNEPPVSDGELSSLLDGPAWYTWPRPSGGFLDLGSVVA